jgi:hypothetical protein
MNWLDYIHLDRRSKQPLPMQLEQGLIALMHEELLLQPGQKLNPDELSKQCGLMLSDVLAVFQRLKALDYLHEEKRTWRISHHFFHRYYFTRPFAFLPSSQATPFTEVVLDQGWMALPKNLTRFVPNAPSLVYHIREHFLHRGVGIGVSDTYYLVPSFDAHHPPSTATLESLRHSYTSYDREVNLIPKTKALTKWLPNQPMHDFFLQGTYGLYQGDQCVICGTVTTLTSYSYRTVKKSLPLTHLF